MADIKEQADWPEGIYLIEKTDPVEGGEDGVDNRQAKALANRTQYLKKALEDSNSAAASQIELEKTYVDSLQTKRRLFEVSGTENDIIITSKAGVTPITELNDFDEFSFIVAATNTDVVTIKIDDLPAKQLMGVVSDTQIFKTALLTVRYINGAFYIADQINPKTGNSVLDIAKLWTDTTDILRPGEYALSGYELSRADHPIAWAIASASSNVIDQATKDADLEAYAGYYGTGDGSTTFTLPMIGGEFIRMFDDGRGIDAGRAFGSYQKPTYIYDRLNNASSAAIGFQNIDGELPQVSGIFYSGGVGGASTTTPKSTRPRSIAYYGKTRL